MRARYYSPELRRFVNADIIKGEITNAITLNRYAYANGNPVSNVDPFGLFTVVIIPDFLLENNSINFETSNQDEINAAKESVREQL